MTLVGFKEEMDGKIAEIDGRGAIVTLDEFIEKLKDGIINVRVRSFVVILVEFKDGVTGEILEVNWGGVLVELTGKLRDEIGEVIMWGRVVV